MVVAYASKRQARDGLRLAAALLVGFLASNALAQQSAAPRTVGKLVDVQGNVLVSQGDAMVAASNDQRVALDARVVTTASARVTVSYDKGCDVRLGENQRFVVRELGECAALIASVETLGPAAGAIGGGTTAATAGGFTTGSLVAVGVVTGVGVYELLKNDKKPKSPN